MDFAQRIRNNVRRRLLVCLLCLVWYYIKEVRPRFLRVVKGKRTYSMIEKMSVQKSFIDKLTTLSDTHFYNVLRMNRACFHRFCHLLKTSGGLVDEKYVSIVEKVASFLLIVSHHAKQRLVACLFDRSPHTISTYFHDVLRAVLSLHDILLIHPEPVAENCDDRVWKLFQGCVGALDGTYIPVSVKTADQPRYRNRKGFLAVNVLAVCDRKMRFVHVLTGWEGSAADGRVLRDALSRPNGLKVAQGTYYLVDAGYANAPGFLAPFRSVRYHLKEWATTNQAPQNAKEYFNLKHSSARNMIERTFGVLKKRFAILRSPSFYPIETQNCIILACCLIHNFIRMNMEHDPGEDDLSDDEDDFSDALGRNVPCIENINQTPAWTRMRDELARTMFTEYRTRRNRHH